MLRVSLNILLSVGRVVLTSFLQELYGGSYLENFVRYIVIELAVPDITSIPSLSYNGKIPLSLTNTCIPLFNE